MEWIRPTVSLILALSIFAAIVGGLILRSKDGRGIGWQFIRLVVLVISIPTAAILALNGSLNGEAATIIAGAMGYAFGNMESRQQDSGKTSNE